MNTQEKITSIEERLSKIEGKAISYQERPANPGILADRILSRIQSAVTAFHHEHDLPGFQLDTVAGLREVVVGILAEGLAPADLHAEGLDAALTYARMKILGEDR